MRRNCSATVSDTTCPRSVDGILGPRDGTPRPALFLDRDGVINIDHGYTHRREDFVFVPGIFDLARRAAECGHAIVVVTNQAGIARGLYGEQTFSELTQWMVEEFADHRAPVERVYYCPHHVEARLKAYRLACHCRKPEPGMLLAACQDLRLDAAGSKLVGDKLGDLQAGTAAGIGTLVLFGHDPLPRGFRRATDLRSLADQLF